MSNIVTQLNTIEKKAFWGLCLVSVSLLFFYGYFVNSTVLNIVERRNIQNELEVLSSTFSTLESKYLALAAKIDIEFAYILGFTEAQNVKFVTKTGLAFTPPR